MNSHGWKVRSALTVAALFCLTAVSGVFVFYPNFFAKAAEGPDQSVVSDLNKQIDEQRAKIDALTAKITEYNENIKSTRQEAATLKTQIKIIDNQVGKTNMEITLKEEQAKEVQLQIEQTGMQIGQLEAQMLKEKDQLSNLLRLISRYEDKNYINILLANDSFSDFFDQVKYSTDLQEEMQRTLNRIKETNAKLTGQKEDLEGQREDLSAILNKLDDTKAVLVSQKQDKNQLVAATNKSEKKFQALVTDLKKEQAAANALVTALEKKLRAELAKKGSAEKFNSLGNAVLVWPTVSHRITSTFHDADYPYRNLFEHSGLDIGVGKGTAVKAAEAGYVAKVAYNTQWYGSYVMIIHGGNITTLYGHLSSIGVSQDQYVTRGQQIGLSGSTGFSSGPHLHFEVRSNGIPVDPQNYLP